MKRYDYLLVGSGLYSGVFAWYAKQKGKTCLVVEKRDHMYTNTEPIFSIPATGKYGIL